MMFLLSQAGSLYYALALYRFSSRFVPRPSAPAKRHFPDSSLQLKARKVATQMLCGREQGHWECVHFECHAKAPPFPAEDQHSILFVDPLLTGETGSARRYDDPYGHRPASTGAASVHQLYRTQAVSGDTRTLAIPYVVLTPVLPRVPAASNKGGVSDLVSL